MAKGYRRVDRDQPFLMPPDLRDWVPVDHPVHWVIEVVGQLDTGAVHGKRRTGGVGRQGYDPDMMLTLLIWAWSQGQRSSRQIERLCAQDVIYRYICAGNLPDHTSIARFRKELGDAVEDLFTQVLVLCAELGMVRLGVVALDGTKIAADASKDANRTEKGLLAALERQMAREAAKAAAEHDRTDQHEDDLFGPGGRGDVVPDDPRTGPGRSDRTRAALAKVRQRKQERDQRQEPPKTLRGKQTRPATPEQVELAQARYDRLAAAQQAKIDRWEAGPRRGSAPRPVQESVKVQEAAAVLERVQSRVGLPARTTDRHGRDLREPVANTTDPDSALQPTRGGGYLQGYNAQAMTSDDGLIIGTSVSANPTDAPTFEPMITAAMQVAQMLAPHRPGLPTIADAGIGMVLADAGYLSEQNLTCPGPYRLVAVGKRRQLEHDARHNPAQGEPPDNADAITTMAHRLRIPEGIAAYRKRGHIAETPFGNTKHNRNFRRMTGRGLARAEADWSFNALVHNLGKAFRHTLAT